MSCPTIRPPTLAADVLGHRSTSRVRQCRPLIYHAWHPCCEYSSGFGIRLEGFERFAQPYSARWCATPCPLVDALKRLERNQVRRSLATSLIDVAGLQASTLTASGGGFTSYGRPCRCAGPTRTKSWGQTIGDTRHAPAIKGAPACCTPGPSRQLSTRGIEADVGFITLASEPTGTSLDRGRTGRYRRRAGVGSASKAVCS